MELKITKKFVKFHSQIIFLKRSPKSKNSLTIFSDDKNTLSLEPWVRSQAQVDFKKTKVFYKNDKWFYFLLLPDFEEEENHGELVRELGNKIKTNIIEPSHLDIDLTGLSKDKLNLKCDFILCLSQGILLGEYSFDKYKTIDKSEGAHIVSKNKIRLHFITNKAQAKKSLEIAKLLAEGTIWARDLLNEPGNKLTAKEMVTWSKKMSKRFSYKHQTLNKQALIRQKMGGIIAVNAGSVIEPALIINEYHHPQAKKTILLVGKGVTFDSGGISLKPSTNMGEMKMDMGGGACVLSALATVARQKLKVNVIGLIPTTDNMPSGSAQRPGDIITMYSGKTVEVDNTDAEGRLILADALSYGIKKYQPNAVVDLATLTGACVIALGHVQAALYSNDKGLLSKMKSAGEISGELCWPMPLTDAYNEQIKSEVADLKNVGGRDAGSITAAKFLEHFVENVPWVHLDIAGTAMRPKSNSYHPKGGTGYGVRLLWEFLKSFE